MTRSIHTTNIRTQLAQLNQGGLPPVAHERTTLPSQPHKQHPPRLIHFDKMEERKNFADSEIFVNLLSQSRITPPPTLGEAACVVAGGYGACHPPLFDILRQLATRLGAALGGTRPAVDAGYLTHEQMIGRSGCSIKPQLYLAFGISGDRMHTVGIDPSAVIVAINQRADAPLCRQADWVLIGDCKAVATWLLETLKGGVHA